MRSSVGTWWNNRGSHFGICKLIYEYNKMSEHYTRCNEKSNTVSFRIFFAVSRSSFIETFIYQKVLLFIVLSHSIELSSTIIILLLLIFRKCIINQSIQTPKSRSHRLSLQRPQRKDFLIFLCDIFLYNLHSANCHILELNFIAI